MRFKNLLMLLVAIGSVAIGEINIKLGDPVSRVLTALGEPSGTATKGGVTYYIYDGGIIVAKDGKVVEIPKDFEVESQRKQVEKEMARLEKLKQEEFIKAQKAKGLVLYQGRWVTPDRKAKLEADQEAQRLASEAASRPKLLLLSWRWHVEYGYASAEGEVQNISNESLKNVEAVAKFYTTDDKFITSSDSLIEFNPILPGQKSPFKTSVSHNPEMERARIDFKELMGGSIPWKQ